MVLNKFYSHRDNPSEVYELVEMTASTACFTHNPFFKAAITKEVQHEDLKNWTRRGKYVPALILQQAVVALQPTQSNHIALDEAKLQVQFGLHHCHMEPLPTASRMLCFCQTKHNRVSFQGVFFVFFLCQWLWTKVWWLWPLHVQHRADLRQHQLQEAWASAAAFWPTSGHWPRESHSKHMCHFFAWQGRGVCSQPLQAWLEESTSLLCTLLLGERNFGRP